uniref:Archaeal Zn-finger protein n=1 Tax=Archaeoglobus fulgidus TaxID=2234 RepID=A0A7J2TJI3_ARCFL
MELYCDGCKDVTRHEVVKPNLYRCSICGTHTHFSPPKEVEIKAIFSSGEKTEIGKIKVPENEEMAKGSEIIVDFEDGSRLGRITAIQLKDGRMVEFSRAKDVYSVWLRNVGEVLVKFSLHKRAVTTPYKMLFDGETEFRVGELINIEGKKYRIHRIKLLDGGLLKREGEAALAKDIKRIYATYTP